MEELFNPSISFPLPKVILVFPLPLPLIRLGRGKPLASKFLARQDRSGSVRSRISHGYLERKGKIITNVVYFFSL